MYTFIALNLCLLTDSKALGIVRVQSCCQLSVYLLNMGGKCSTGRKPKLKKGQVPTSSASKRHLGIKCFA